MNEVRIAVATGEFFQVSIAYNARDDLELNLVDSVWVNFKSNSVMAF